MVNTKLTTDTNDTGVRPNTAIDLTLPVSCHRSPEKGRFRSKTTSFRLRTYKEIQLPLPEIKTKRRILFICFFEIIYCSILQTLFL